MSTAEPTIKDKVKTKIDLPVPNRYKVIYMNDETTTMEFVIQSLIEIFNHSPEEAESTCMEIHKEGSAVVAVLPYELAEQKVPLRHGCGDCVPRSGPCHRPDGSECSGYWRGRDA